MILIAYVDGIFMCLNPGDIVGEHYRIVRVLGRGGFGVTYQAQDIREEDNNVFVALKQIPIPQQNKNGEVRGDRYVADLEREANTLRNLRHARIPKFIDEFRENNYFYIVQEYIPGRSLEEEIIPGERIDEQEIIKMLREILVVLKFVHRHNIIHRDIKPANLIRRGTDNKIVLIDFGAVKEVETIHQNSLGDSITRMVGTRGYLPNEQAIGNPQFNSDIYALGIIILQTITDFSIDNIRTSNSEPKLDNQCNYIWQDEAYPEVSQGLKKIVSKMIRYNFNQRYQSVRKVLEDLDRLEAREEIIIIDDEPISEINFVPNSSQSEIEAEDESDDNNDNSTVQDEGNKIISIKRKILFGSIAISAILLISLLFWKRNSILALINPACDFQQDDHISCGEEILSSTNEGNDDLNNGINFFNKKEYNNALTSFKSSWEQKQEPESLIYMNNALLESINVKYHTLIVSVPLKYDDNIDIRYDKLGQDFLRGVAQAQTEVNLDLLDFYSEQTSDSKQKYELPGQDFLNRKIIDSKIITKKNQPKGLRIVIADDRNNANHTKDLAQKIANKQEILGVIGHYASGISWAAADEYEKQNLIQVSFGSTSIDFTSTVRNNFFRVVYTNEEEAKGIVDSINELEIPDKKAAIFYNYNNNKYSIDIKGKIKDLIEVFGEDNNEFNLANPDFNVSNALETAKDLETNIFILLPDGQESNALANAIDLIKQDNGETEIIGGNTLLNPQVERIETSNPLKLTVSSSWHYLNEPESEFTINSQKLWGVEKIHPGTYTAYDATSVLIEAIRQQKNPTRKGTLNKISERGFNIPGSTGHIQFNTPQNGDRLDFPATIVKLCNIDNQNDFMPLNKDINKKQNLCS